MTNRANSRDRFDRPGPWAALAVVATLLMVGALLAPAAQAIPSSRYSMGGANCSGNEVDPVGLVWYGKAARKHQIYNDIRQHFPSMSANAQVNTQSVYTTGESCVPNHYGPATPCSGFPYVICPRYHIRLFGSPYVGDDGRRWTVGTPHYETVVNCGHAIPPAGTSATEPGSGFDWARREIVEEYDRLEEQLNAHPVKVVDWGNSALKKQCNYNSNTRKGWMSGSNGKVGYIKFGLLSPGL